MKLFKKVFHNKSLRGLNIAVIFGKGEHLYSQNKIPREVLFIKTNLIGDFRVYYLDLLLSITNLK